jgi:uncharacterized RDD family membrane protein YckC
MIPGGGSFPYRFTLFLMRSFAFVMDLIIAFFITAALFPDVFQVTTEWFQQGGSTVSVADLSRAPVEVILFYNASYIIMGLYQIGCSILHGTLGQKFMGLRLIQRDFSGVDFRTRLKRQFALATPWLLVGLGVVLDSPAMGLLGNIFIYLHFFTFLMVLHPAQQSLVDTWTRTSLIHRSVLLRLFETKKQDTPVTPEAPPDTGAPASVSIASDGVNQLWTVGDRWPLELHCACGQTFLIEKPGTYECPECTSRAVVTDAMA